MGAIGYSTGGSFSPDGQRIAFITNASGVPNVWMANTDGSDLKQVTHSEDQVGGVSWNPVNDTLALDIAPGGGLNRQRYLRYSSSAENEAGMDCWLHDTDTGENRLIAKNQGIGSCLLSPDATQAVVWRMVSRGNTNLYLVDLQSGTEQLLTPHVGVALSQSPLWLDNDTVVFASNVDRVIAPTIVLHGANDTNVPVVEAEQVVENLQERGVPVQYVLFEDEGHGWGKVENRVTSDVEIVRWFEEHL